MVADSTCSLPHPPLPAQPQFPFPDSKPTDPSWGIEVSDNGQGMSSADLPRMLRLYADQSYAGAAKKVRAVWPIGHCCQALGAVAAGRVVTMCQQAAPPAALPAT